MNLQSVHGADLTWKKRTRVGLGKSAGQGKTAGKGSRGQTVRSGHSLIPYFEGGQMPLARKLPKRGFNNRRFSSRWSEVNLETLDKLFKDGEEANPRTLLERGATAQPRDGVRILGGGKLAKKLVVRAHHFTRSAEAAIVGAGGQAVRIKRLRPYSAFAHVKLSQLQNKFDAGAVIDPAALLAQGLVKDGAKPVRIVAGGTLTKKFIVRAARFSRLAMDQIRAHGGSTEVLASQS